MSKLYKNDGKGKVGEGIKQLMIQIIPHHLSNIVEAILWHRACMAANGPLVFIKDLSTDKSNRMNSEV